MAVILLMHGSYAGDPEIPPGSPPEVPPGQPPEVPGEPLPESEPAPPPEAPPDQPPEVPGTPAPPETRSARVLAVEVRLPPRNARCQFPAAA